MSNASHLHMDFYADIPLGEQPPVRFSFTFTVSIGISSFVHSNRTPVLFCFALGPRISSTARY